METPLPNPATPLIALLEKGHLIARLDPGDKMPELPPAIRVALIFDKEGDGPAGYDWKKLWPQIDLLFMAEPEQIEVLKTTLSAEAAVEAGKRVALILTKASVLSAWILTLLDAPGLAAAGVGLAFKEIPPGAKAAITEVKRYTK